jgi:hypothetical protein
VEGEVQETPQLLAEGGKVRGLDPVKVDEEDAVDCRGGSRDDSNSLGVCITVSFVRVVG